MTVISDKAYYERAIRRGWWVVVLCAVLTGGLAYGVASHSQKLYTASAALLFNGQNDAQSLFGVASSSSTPIDPSEQSATYLQLVSLAAISRATSVALHGARTATQIADEVKPGSANQSEVITIAATDPSPALAAKIANSYAQQYIKYSSSAARSQIVGAQVLVNRELTALTKSQLASQEGQTLVARRDQLSLLAALQTGDAEVIQRATPPASASSPKAKLDTLVGLVLGLALGVGVALLRDRLNDKISDLSELEAIYGAPVLAQIPETNELSRSHTGGIKLAHAASESFQMLEAQLRYFNVDKRLTSVLITSAAPSEGKSTVAWNLAVAASRAENQRVLLVEADLRRPVQAARHGLDASPGLADILTGVTRDSALQLVSVAEDHVDVSGTLDVITAGIQPPNPAALLSSVSMSELLGSVEDEYDLVIIDSAPTSLVSDSLPLVGRVSGVIVVADLTHSSRPDAVELRNQLERLNARTLGTVYNRAKGHGSYEYYATTYTRDEPASGSADSTAVAASS